MKVFYKSYQGGIENDEVYREETKGRKKIEKVILFMKAVNIENLSESHQHNENPRHFKGGQGTDQNWYLAYTQHEEEKRAISGL